MNLWTLDKSTILRNGCPVFAMAGIHTGETTPQERKRLRERVVRLLNEDAQRADPYICDWIVEGTDA